MDKLEMIFRKSYVTVTGTGIFTLYRRQPNPDPAFALLGMPQEYIDTSMVRVLQMEFGIRQVLPPSFPLISEPASRIGVAPSTKGNGIYNGVMVSWRAEPERKTVSSMLYAVRVDHDRKIVGVWGGDITRKEFFLHEKPSSPHIEVTILEEDGTPVTQLH